MKKSALLERLVRLAATDIPGTPRMVMRHRSPEELAALQHGVSGAFRKFEDPVKQHVHGVIDKVPHERTRNALKSVSDMMIENPETIPMKAVPIPGISLGYLAAKKGLERGIDKLAPIPKLAFTTSSYSGALNPVIETGASFQPGFKVPSLKAPVQQKVAFKLQGEMKFQGLDIAIENKPGSVRKGVDKDGKPWRTVMKWPYGYIRGTKGADGEDVDCYVGVVKDAPKAFVVHQKKDDGSYDEDKVMLGFESAEAARKGYLEHYNTDKFLGPIKAVAMDRFKKLVESGKKLVKISASSPTRGGFMLASDIPQFKAPSLRAPIEKNSDFLPDYVTYNEGDFKKSKYAAAIDRERMRTQLLLEERLRDFGEPTGDISKEDAVPAVKQADISPTQPLGDGGGNPHRMQSWLASPRTNSLRAPLNKVAEDGGGDYGGPAGFYYGSWQSSGGRGPVNEAGFRQASDQNGVPVNSLKAPLKKLAGFLATSPSASKHIGQKPFMQTSVADVAKPKGQKFGGPLPGANSTTLGGYNPPSLK
jgi:hypothetical protein